VTPRRPSDDQDARETRRASFLIGWQIMLASAVLVLGIVSLAIVFLLHQSLPREQLDQLPIGRPRVYVDAGDLVQALILIGIGAVVFAGVVSWIIARRAVTPLGTALRLQRQFVADASHELRTPLAVLDARIQVLERRLRSAAPAEPEETAKTVAELRTDSKALIDIVNDLLLAAGGTDETGSHDPVSVAPIAQEALDSLRILAAERHVALVLDAGDDEILVRMPSTSLRRAVVALVDNAVTHSPEGGTVTVRLRREGARLVLTVTDEGAGITGITPERVFERFAHAPAQEVTATRVPARPSFGIGLALVREIAQRQGGRVFVAETSATGTSIRFDVPAVA
jgi:two-component system OmpR family sensor kinase